MLLRFGKPNAKDGELANGSFRPIPLSTQSCRPQTHCRHWPFVPARHALTYLTRFTPEQLLFKQIRIVREEA